MIVLGIIDRLLTSVSFNCSYLPVKTMTFGYWIQNNGFWFRLTDGLSGDSGKATILFFASKCVDMTVTSLRSKQLPVSPICTHWTWYAPSNRVMQLLNTSSVTQYRVLVSLFNEWFNIIQYFQVYLVENRWGVKTRTFTLLVILPTKDSLDVCTIQFRLLVL